MIRRIGLVLACGFVTSTAYSRALTLSELKAAMQQQGATWTAEETGAATALGIHEGRENPFGLSELVELPDLNQVEQTRPRVALPPSWDWRNKDGQNYMSPIRNQAYCGACVAFAAVGMLEGQINVTANHPGLDLNLSEQDLFGKIGKCETGSTPFFALLAMRYSGVTDEACFPYTSGRMGDSASSSNACSDRSSRTFKILSSETLRGKDEVKEAVMQGPVMTTMNVYEDFMFYTGGVYRHVTGDKVGGHAVTIVGWSDADGAWIVRNSWSETWGERGYFRIKFDDISGVGSRGYAIKVKAPGTMTKVIAPGYFTAVSGGTTITTDAPQQTPAVRTVNIQMKGKGQVTDTASMQINGGRAAGIWDSTQVSDGLYEVSSKPTLADGTEGPAFYQLLVVANQRQNIAMNVEPDFDARQPVKDRVYFKVQSNETDVPLTSVDLVIKKVGQTTTQTITAEFPGTESMVGWRTASFANGTYEIKAIGHIGNTQQFVSSPVTVTVAN